MKTTILPPIMNLVLLFESDKIDEKRYSLNDHRSEHIRTILKLNPGDSLQVGLLNGPQGTAVIESINDDRLNIVTQHLSDGEMPIPETDIVCALPRPQTLKKILFIAGMTGIRHLYLIRANRVEKSYFHSPLLESDNYARHLYEGLSQGKRTRLPQVSVHKRFKTFFEDDFKNLKDVSSDSIKLLPEIDHENSLTDIYTTGNKHAVVAIGPEGGWVPFEIDVMLSHGFRQFRLSSSILRVEHALMACLSQIELLDHS